MIDGEFRDERVGDALRHLDVPEHRSGFFSELAARLEAERAVAAQPRRPMWLSPRALTALAASVLALAVAVSLVSRRDHVGNTVEPKLVTASAVRARVADALASLTTLTGELTVECAVNFGECSPPHDGGRTTKRWSFATTASGDERVTGIGFLNDTAFSAEDRVQRELVDFGNGPEGVEIKNAGAGAPDAFSRSALRRNFGSLVRSFLADDSDAPVEGVIEDGRDAWRLAMEVTPNKLAGPDGSGDRLEVVVDQQSGFPLRITESLRGRFLHETRLTKVVADAPLPASTFHIVFPPGARVFRQDAGFRRVSRDQAARIVGYDPLVPTALPPGFVLAEVLAAPTGSPTGKEGANPPAAGVVSLAFRRGFDRIVVSTRLRGSTARCADRSGTGSTACWADPLASGEGNRDEPERITITDGAARGAYAELVRAPRGVPHVWAIGERLVITVSGDASASELRRIIESL